VIVDVIIFAMLYVIRVIAGAVAIEDVLSEWLLAFSMFIFMALWTTIRSPLRGATGTACGGSHNCRAGVCGDLAFRSVSQESDPRNWWAAPCSRSRERRWPGSHRGFMRGISARTAQWHVAPWGTPRTHNPHEALLQCQISAGLAGR
jgi:hypothetical protein